MSAPRSRPIICRARRSYISGSPAQPRSKTIANRPSDNMRWPPRPETLVGPPIESSSSTRTSGSPAPASSRDRALPGSPPKWRLPMSAWFSDSRSLAWRATTPIGIA